MKSIVRPFTLLGARITSFLSTTLANVSKPKNTVTNTYRFHEFDIPIDLLNMTGGGIDTFDVIADAHMNNLRKFIGISPDHSIVEIGCGIGRDAIPLTKILSKRGRYLGVDIIKRSIDFCNQNIKARYNNFDFVHYDVADQLHNPNGSTKTTDIRLPVPDQSVDRIIVWSVFTHLYETDIRHYLSEFRRLLKIDGLAYITVFIVDEAILDSARKTNLTPFNLRFEYKLSENCFINDPDFPLGAIAYRRNALQSMINDAGLELKRNFLRGSWSGFYKEPEDGQDAMILGPGRYASN
jgi:ubiquinone/menaquinone biosynthesis C-methylase UbiE